MSHLLKNLKPGLSSGCSGSYSGRTDCEIPVGPHSWLIHVVNPEMQFLRNGLLCFFCSQSYRP
eukprot:2277780-Heterocapsa_arctica.AAC.1